MYGQRRWRSRSQATARRWVSPAGRVAKHQLFLLEGLEQAAQGDVDRAGLVALPFA